MEIDTSSKFLPPKSLGDSENPVEDQVSNYAVCMCRCVYIVLPCSKMCFEGAYNLDTHNFVSIPTTL